MAVIGPLFFLLMLTILDLGLMLANQSLLEGAARDAARLIRTGQVQTATSPITTFQNLLCSDMGPVMTTAQCTANIIFEVQTFTSFGSVSFTPCVRNNNDTADPAPPARSRPDPAATLSASKRATTVRSLFPGSERV